MKKLSLILVLVIRVHSDNLKTDLEIIDRAYNISAKANHIYPETVKGIGLHLENSNDADFIKLQSVITILNSSTVLKIKTSKLLVGTLQFCQPLITTRIPSVRLLVEKIMEMTDFLISYAIAGDNTAKFGATASITYCTKFWSKESVVARSMNPNLKFSALSQWQYAGNHHWQNSTEFRSYWQQANDWATENNFLFYMHEAFDNPIQYQQSGPAKRGWWKLKQNKLIDSVKGYKENVVGK